MMRSRADYDAAFELVRQVVADWDPYCLLAEGAPSDEFGEEIALVVARIPKIESPESAAAHLSEVFSRQFEPELFSIEQCRAPGRSLFERLVAAGYVETE